MPWKLFKGIEVEGCRAGRLTLFVENTPPDEAIREIYTADKQITQIYFGAKFKTYSRIPSFISLVQIEELGYTLCRGDSIITAEVEGRYLLDWISSKARLNNFIFEFIIPVTSLLQAVKLKSMLHSTYYPRTQFKFFSKEGVILVKADSITHTDAKIYTQLDDKLIKQGT